MVTAQTQPCGPWAGLGLCLRMWVGEEGPLRIPEVEVAVVTQAPRHQETATGQNHGQGEGGMIKGRQC